MIDNQPVDPFKVLEALSMTASERERKENQQNKMLLAYAKKKDRECTTLERSDTLTFKIDRSPSMNKRSSIYLVFSNNVYEVKVLKLFVFRALEVQAVKPRAAVGPVLICEIPNRMHRLQVFWILGMPTR